LLERWRLSQQQRRLIWCTQPASLRLKPHTRRSLVNGGAQVNDVPALKAQGVNPHVVGEALVRLFGQLTLCHAFMHGDPHSGAL
jgi:hypothetical protein